jgi:hypothetical protein
MVMVEYPANTPARALGDFPCALGGAYADVLPSHSSTLAHIASGVERVKGHQVTRTLPYPLGGRSGALGGSFADVPRTMTDITPRAGLPLLRGGGRRLGRRRLGGRLLGRGLLSGWLLRRRWRCVGRLLRGLGLAILTGGFLAAEDKYECEKHDGKLWENASHGARPPVIFIRCVSGDFAH